MTAGEPRGRRRRRAVGGTRPPDEGSEGAERSRPGPPADDPFRRSADDTDTGWGDPGDDSDEDRLRRDVPPHWQG